MCVIMLGMIIGICFQYITSGYDFGAVDKKLLVALVTGGVALVKASVVWPKRVGRIGADIIQKEYAHIIGGAFSENRKGEKTLINAIELYIADKYKKALPAFKKMLGHCETNEELAVVWFFIGCCYSDTQSVKMAAEAYETAIQYSPSHESALNNLGRSYSRLGDVPAAIKTYERLLAVNGNNHLALNNLSIIYLEQLEPEKAIKYAAAALEAKPDMYQAMNTLAIGYTATGDTVKAEEYYRRSLATGHSDAEALRSRMEDFRPTGIDPS